jgi:hypothetical protein
MHGSDTLKEARILANGPYRSSHDFLCFGFIEVQAIGHAPDYQVSVRDDPDRESFGVTDEDATDVFGFHYFRNFSDGRLVVHRVDRRADEIFEHKNSFQSAVFLSGAATHTPLRFEG